MVCHTDGPTRAGAQIGSRAALQARRELWRAPSQLGIGRGAKFMMTIENSCHQTCRRPEWRNSVCADELPQYSLIVAHLPRSLPNGVAQRKACSAGPRGGPASSGLASRPAPRAPLAAPPSNMVRLAVCSHSMAAPRPGPDLKTMSRSSSSPLARVLASRPLLTSARRRFVRLERARATNTRLVFVAPARARLDALAGTA